MVKKFNRQLVFLETKTASSIGMSAILFCLFIPVGERSSYFIDEDPPYHPPLCFVYELRPCSDAVISSPCNGTCQQLSGPVFPGDPPLFGCVGPSTTRTVVPPNLGFNAQIWSDGPNAVKGTAVAISETICGKRFSCGCDPLAAPGVACGNTILIELSDIMVQNWLPINTEPCE